MRRRLSPSAWLLAVCAAIALLLTVVRPSPHGLGVGLGQAVVRAAPGQSNATVQRAHDLSALRIVNNTLLRVGSSYVDPARIDPKEMLYGALDSVQFNIPEVLVEPDRAGDRVVIVVNDQKQTFSTADVDAPWRLSALLKKIMRFIEANMNPGADFAAVEYAAVNGMLGTLDPHSLILDPETAREMDVTTSGHFGGLGIVIRMIKRKLTVVRPMRGTPAYKAGIKAGDHIIKIDQEITENLTLTESVNRMRGKQGTQVTLWVKRKGSDALLKKPLVRAQIRVPSVRHKLLSKKVGYIRIEQFAGRTTDEVRAAMKELKSKGAKRWVLDLRSNPGGLLEQAIRVSDLFINKGHLVTTVGGRERDARAATRKGTDSTSPMAVLVNGGSASASEIVAGAIKNLNRGVVIGTDTFGKGSVQILYDNDDGSKLKLTIAEYLTPGDLSIQSIGIVPDIALNRMFIPTKNTEAKDFLRLQQPSRRYGEKDLKSHLNSRYARKMANSDSTLSFLYEKKGGKSPPIAQAEADEDTEAGNFPPGISEENLDSDDFVIDYEIELARDVLASAGTPSRNETLRKARSFLAKRTLTEESRVKRRLEKLGIDWSAPPADAAAPSLTSSFTVESQSPIHAGDIVKIKGQVTNTGSTPAYRVQARLAGSEDSYFSDREFVFGMVPPGETRTWTAYIKLHRAALSRIERLTPTLLSAGKALPPPPPLLVKVAAAPRPTFAYTHQLIDSGNGDGLVQAGEKFRLRVTIKNTGKGVAKETTAMLRNASGDAVRLDKARFELNELAPGDSKTVEFAFQTTQAATVSKDGIVIEMTVYDSVLGESVAEKLKYAVHGPSAGPVAKRGRVEVRSAAPVFQGATDKSGIIATAKPGSVFAVTGTLGEWFAIDLGKGRPGFLRRSATKSTSRALKLTGLEPHWQVTPPVLRVAAPSGVVHGARIRLRGKVTDEKRVEDVYIFVSNRSAKISNRKVFYRSNRRNKGASSMDIDADIPLWPGDNLIQVVARENQDVRTSHTMYLYRGKPGASASSPTPAGPRADSASAPAGN